MTEQERRYEILKAEESIRVLLGEMMKHGDGAKKADQAREALNVTTEKIAAIGEIIASVEAAIRTDVVPAVASVITSSRDEFRQSTTVVISEIRASQKHLLEQQTELRKALTVMTDSSSARMKEFSERVGLLHTNLDGVRNQGSATAEAISNAMNSLQDARTLAKVGIGLGVASSFGALAALGLLLVK